MSVPPVLSLDDHTLGIVFLLNTFPDTEFMHEMFNPHCIPLRTSRAVSQVCSRWRNMALEFPLLWADSLDLNALDQRNSDWRNLVMDRTKSCPLSVRYHAKKEDKEAKLSFFMELLSKEWPRMRRLNVQFDHFQDDPRWDIIETATDNIEMLVFGFRNRTPRKFIFPCLPSLRVLSVRGCLTQLHGGTQSLRSLRLLKLDTDLSPSAFFATLTHMNFLEDLEVSHFNNSDLPRPLVATPINLPKLTSLSVESGTLRTFIFYLAHISDAPLRNSFFYGPTGRQTSEDNDDLSESEISTLNSLLKGYFGRIAKTYKLNYIGFTISQSMFFLETTDSTCSVYPKLLISYCQGMSALSLLQPTSEGLSMGDLSNVTTLALYSDMYAEDFKFTEATTGCLLKFFNSLESVSRLKIVITSVLRIFRVSQRQNKDGMVILPRLETLVFTDPPFVDEPEWDEFIQFLDERKKLGHPIQLIELEDYDLEDEGFSFLKGIDDVVIKSVRSVTEAYFDAESDY